MSALFGLFAILLGIATVVAPAVAHLGIVWAIVLGAAGGVCIGAGALAIRGDL